MKKKILLGDIVDLLRETGENLSYILNLDEEQYDFFYTAEDMEVSDERNPEHYIKLPVFDSNEVYNWMQKFSMKQDESKRDSLFRILNSPHPFGNFKSFISEMNLYDSWIVFCDEQYYYAAVQWCKENDLPYVERREDFDGEFVQRSMGR